MNPAHAASPEPANGGTKRTRIGIFVPDLGGGGAERVMANLARGLAEMGYAPDLVLAKARGPFLSHVAPGVRVVDLAAPHTMLSLPHLVRYLRRERPAALLTALHQASVVGVAAKRYVPSIPVAVTVHNTVSVEISDPRNARMRLMPAFIRRAYPKADHLIAVSQGSADDLAKVIDVPRERIKVILNPVVMPELFERAAEPVDHPWLQPGQPPVIIAVGRLTQQKDYPTLLRAFALLRKQRDVRLIILGQGEDQPALEALARELGIEDSMQLPGFADNPFAYMNKAAMLAMSSRWEGLPTVLIEALASGTCVVSTDCPSGPREILEGGKYGILVPMQDPPALADAMARMLDERSVPPAESWAPYTLASAATHYAETLFGDATKPGIV